MRFTFHLFPKFCYIVSLLILSFLEQLLHTIKIASQLIVSCASFSSKDNPCFRTIFRALAVMTLTFFICTPLSILPIICLRVPKIAWYVYFSVSWSNSNATSQPSTSTISSTTVFDRMKLLSSPTTVSSVTQTVCSCMLANCNC